jgi:hypothetical protein
MKTVLDRKTFNDGVAFSRAMRLHGPTCVNDIGHFTGLSGIDGNILDATWGDDTARDAELLQTAKHASRLRPHIFVAKFPGRRGVPQTNSAVLKEDDFSEILSASCYARARGWMLDFSVTLNFLPMGCETATDVERTVRQFIKVFGQFLRDNGLPVAFILVVENAPTTGLHCHVLINAPVDFRAKVKRWVYRFAARLCAEYNVTLLPTALRVRGHNKRHPLLHDRLASYVLKGCDADLVVRRPSETLDDREVRLSDLIADEPSDPGHVPFRRFHIGSDICARSRGTWRSSFELGSRDVRDLWQPEFLRWVSSRVVGGREDDVGSYALVRRFADDVSSTIDAMFVQGLEGYAAIACHVTLEMLLSHLDRLACDMLAVIRPNLALCDAISTYKRSVRATSAVLSSTGQRIAEMLNSRALPEPLLNNLLRLLDKVAAQIDLLMQQIRETPPLRPWRLDASLACLAV